MCRRDARSGVSRCAERFALTGRGGLKTSDTKALVTASLLFNDFEAEFFDNGIG